jgi:hypothetical protein
MQFHSKMHGPYNIKFNINCALFPAVSPQDITYLSVVFFYSARALLNRYDSSAGIVTRYDRETAVL